MLGHGSELVCVLTTILSAHDYNFNFYNYIYVCVCELQVYSPGNYRDRDPNSGTRSAEGSEAVWVAHACRRLEVTLAWSGKYVLR